MIGVAADTTDEESMAAGVAETVRTFGSLYGLVTAAGIRQTAAGFTEIDLRFWRTIMEVNVTGTLMAIRAAAPRTHRHQGRDRHGGLGDRRGRAHEPVGVRDKQGRRAAPVQAGRPGTRRQGGAGELPVSRCDRHPMIEQAIRTDGPTVLEEKLQGVARAVPAGNPTGSARRARGAGGRRGVPSVQRCFVHHRRRRVRRRRRIDAGVMP